MSNEPDIVVVRVAKSPFDGQVIAGVLREAGIVVHISGRALNDEFAMSQALANLTRVEIQVPRSQLADAERALAEADKASELLDKEGFDPGEPIE